MALSPWGIQLVNIIDGLRANFMSHMTKSYKRGFTLIELLVVIAIIGILSSIVLASLNSARKKGRDARRIADVKQIQLALELSFDAFGVYPLTVGSLVTSGYIAALPKDPTDLDGYPYAPLAVSGSNAVCSSYHLGTSLETVGHAALNSDSDITTLTPGGTETNPASVVVCDGGTDFHGADENKCLSTDAGATCFDVRP